MLRVERENQIASSNTNIGEHAQQSVSVYDAKSLELALESLAKEQDALARAQEQIGGLIEILKSK